MNQKLGMDTGTARAKRDAMQLQINALTAIATDLSTTYTAAQHPQVYGIESGERTIAPWSMFSLSSARGQIQGASAAASGLLQRIAGEALSQDLASAGDAVFGAVSTGVTEFKDARNWISRPRTLLELPAALRMMYQQPSVWRTAVKPANWGIRGANEGGAALRKFTRTVLTPRWIRSAYQGASNLKFQNYVDPEFLHSRGLHSSPVGRWTDVLHSSNPKLVSGLKTAATGLGKGFAVLGVIGGVSNIATGVSGMMDGHVSSEDGWALADGLVGTITSVGSLAPPPVGVAFAAVGLGYTAGRWLFGEDASGKTGLDRIGDFSKAAGSKIADGAKAVGDFVEDVWPW